MTKIPDYIYMPLISNPAYIHSSHSVAPLSLSLSLSQALKSQSQQHISLSSSHALPPASPHGLAQPHSPMASFSLTALFVQPVIFLFSFLVHFVFHCFFFVCVCNFCVCVFYFEKENHKSKIFVFVISIFVFVLGFLSLCL